MTLVKDIWPFQELGDSSTADPLIIVAESSNQLRKNTPREMCTYDTATHLRTGPLAVEAASRENEARVDCCLGEASIQLLQNSKHVS